MRKLERRDWLGLVVPAIICTLIAYCLGRQNGWIIGAVTGGAFFAVTLWRWRRQIIKYPNDTWKVRL